MFNSKSYRDKSDRHSILDEYRDDHIYENVTNRYKYRILNGIISSVTSKAKDLNILPRKRDKYIPQNDCLPSVSDYNLNTLHAQISDDTSIFERNFEYQMDYENSYTSCEDDNIYENLEFFNDDNFDNSSLNNWMLNLTRETADYETENIMFVKSIPSVFSVKRTTQNTLYRHGSSSNSKNEITLNFLKILWNGENNVDIMSLLLQTFSNLLRDQNKQSSSKCNNNTDCSSLVTIVANGSECKLKKLKKRNIDKKLFYQKFETVILSSSLNTLAITYNKSQKFYFLLAYSDILYRLPAGVYVKQIVCGIRKNLNLNFCVEKEFFKVLRRLLLHGLSNVSAKSRREIDNKSDRSSAIENSENVYQQIWTCQSISNDYDKTGIVNCENIYSAVDYARVQDDNEWEVDHEFSFMNTNVLVLNEKMTNRDFYKTIWIYYDDENPEYNRIFYDSSGMESLHSLKDIKTFSCDDQVLYCDIPQSSQVNKESVCSENSTSTNDISKQDIPENWCASIEAWKNLIRSPYYCEDEEDIIVNESILSSKFSYYNDEEDEISKNVIVHSSNFSLQLDESSSTKSSHESYRSLSEDADIPERITNSPKKEKEKFRDRFKSKLKLKTGKLVIEGNSTESISSKTDDDPEKFLIFGCNLEKIEKDNYHKDVPKIIVECVNILELDINIKTPGIYRISGNKNTIDAIKKRFNEKKQSKKESRHAFLQDQDVHTLTGLLKMFFRELKPPLMTKQIFTQCTSEKHSAYQMGKILREMPTCSYATIKFVFKHLKIIEKYQDENLMNSGNLAICLGLCLFSNSFGEAPNPFDSDISKCNMLCKYLIDNYYEIFESSDEAR